MRDHAVVKRLQAVAPDSPAGLADSRVDIEALRSAIVDENGDLESRSARASISGARSIDHRTRREFSLGGKPFI